jgi:hypothetical protein
VTDEKMLEKLVTHNMQDISELFSLAKKCVRAIEGCTWYSQPSLEAGKIGKSDADAAAQSSGKKKKKKADSKDKPLVGAPTAAATTASGGPGPCGDKWPQQPSDSPAHNSKCHSTEECREIKKLAEQFHEQQKLQPCHDGTPPQQWEGNHQVVQEDDKDEEMAFQDAKRALKAIYDHSNSNSSTDERRKQLHVMYDDSWDITSMRAIKTLRWAVEAATPAPRVAPHHKCMETSDFDASDCPKNMAGAGQLPLVISPTITNVRMCNTPCL